MDHFAPIQPIQYNPALPARDRQVTQLLHHRRSTMKAIYLWSGPRNVSTALMYSFAQRDDTQVVDELSWPAGARPEDGIWAPHWYHALHKSTGFSAYIAKHDFPERLEPLLAECKPWYDKLFERAIRAGTGA